MDCPDNCRPMPQTEVPTSPPGKPPEPFSRRRSTRYEELEPDELLHLIDRLEDERSRARRREGIWISFIAHLLLFWFLFYGPKFRSHQPHVVNPEPNKKDLTYLDLPPDVQKQVRPKPQAAPSDKNRLAQSPHPTLDRKTLEQLQAMRRAGPPQPAAPQPPPPPPAPAPAPAPVPPSPAPQQQARAAAPPPPPAPTPQPSLIPEPTPAPTRPTFDTGPQTAGDAIRQAARNAAQGGPSGDYGQNAPSQHQAMKAGVDILSDTMGVDFGPYMKRLIADTYRSWIPLIPESARPPLDKQGRVGIRFKILPDGSVTQMILEFPSGDVSLDKAAWGGITSAGYPPLPKEFKGPFLELRFGFYYNLNPDKFH
jgi:outer membrane biosynthesis protein TonB